MRPLPPAAGRVAILLVAMLPAFAATVEEDVRAFVDDLKRLLISAPKDVPLGVTDHRKL